MVENVERDADSRKERATVDAKLLALQSKVSAGQHRIVELSDVMAVREQDRLLVATAHTDTMGEVITLRREKNEAIELAAVEKRRREAGEIKVVEEVKREAAAQATRDLAQHKESIDAQQRISNLEHDLARAESSLIDATEELPRVKEVYRARKHEMKRELKAWKEEAKERARREHRERLESSASAKEVTSALETKLSLAEERSTRATAELESKEAMIGDLSIAVANQEKIVRAYRVKEQERKAGIHSTPRSPSSYFRLLLLCSCLLCLCLRSIAFSWIWQFQTLPAPCSVAGLASLLQHL